MSRANFFALTFLTTIACVGVSLGCQQPKYNEIERARIVKEKRLDARDLLAKYREGKEEDIDILEEYVQLQKDTTDLLPATCPLCWASYGEGLSMLGWWWYHQWEAATEDADTEKNPARARALQAEAEETHEKWLSYFEQSNEAMEKYFRSPDSGPPHPYTIERVMRHYELMGNFVRALYYLEKLLKDNPTMDGTVREKLSRLQDLYRREIQKAKERGVLDEGTKAAKKKKAGQRAAAKTRAAPPERLMEELPEDEAP